ncbi:hypothetical protein [Sphingobacterium bovistauri]|uniref:DUF3945 domain-containing protein n=1 Tax=Sphingobacterium bovistauri TaxID=2781959 RepID=A0ABS7Z6D4_9SPHI|nr:hypothetical protein [Sphingobacterium bovistauri]MCA5004961.1 hypothetical protein [Sphingobacterium bovistauri]
MSIDKFQASELLHGRAVNTTGTKWIVPDLNDRDGEGHIKLRAINIPDFDLTTELSRIRGIKLNEEEKEVVIDKLKNGQRVDIQIKTGKNIQKLEIEANPLKREINFYDALHKKASVGNLAVSVPEKSRNVVKMDIDKKRQQRAKI